MSSATTASPASIKAYSRVGLQLYDALVMGVFAERVWGCSPTRLLDHYRTHLTANHADIGVGTGYCLDRCGRRFDRARLALIDLQPNCLRHDAERLARFQPRCYVQDVLQPLHGIEGPSFESIALGGVLHCLAGDVAAKSVVFDNLAPLTASGTLIFGYTLVSNDVRRRPHARRPRPLESRPRHRQPRRSPHRPASSAIDSLRRLSHRSRRLHGALQRRRAGCTPIQHRRPL